MVTGHLVKVITSDGIELQGFWTNEKSDVAVIHFHGTAGDFYSHKFIDVERKDLANKKISFLSVNNRGHDVYADLRKHARGKVKWVLIGGAFERFEDCLFDIEAWLDFLQSQGVKKIILQSHSLSQKILYYQALKNDKRIIGQIHLSPCNDAGFMYYLLGKKEFIKTNEMIKKKIKEGRGRDLLSPKLAVVCPMTVQAYYGYLTEESVGNLFPYHDHASTKWKMLSETKNPLLAIFGEADSFIKPSIKVAARLFQGKAVSSKDVTTKIIPGAPHSFVGYETKLVGMISSWVIQMVT